MRPRVQQWRALRHPLRMCVERGWRWGNRCVISPRGTVFETRHTARVLLARRRPEFGLND